MRSESVRARRMERGLEFICRFHFGSLCPSSRCGATQSRTSCLSFMSSGNLAIDLSGTGAGQFDTLNITGQAALSGLLSIKVFDTGQGGTYTPALGDAFEILTASGGVSGVFDVDVRTAIIGGLGLEPAYLPNSVKLLVVSALGGDYNNDGKVDAADYVVWRKNSGTTNNLPNDSVGGTIGSAQYATWRSNFGKVLAQGAASEGAAIPEPAGALLLTMASTILSCLRCFWPSSSCRNSVAAMEAYRVVLGPCSC